MRSFTFSTPLVSESNLFCGNVGTTKKLCPKESIESISPVFDELDILHELPTERTGKTLIDSAPLNTILTPVPLYAGCATVTVQLIVAILF